MVDTGGYFGENFKAIVSVVSLRADVLLSQSCADCLGNRARYNVRLARATEAAGGTTPFRNPLPRRTEHIPLGAGSTTPKTLELVPQRISYSMRFSSGGPLWPPKALFVGKEACL